MPATASVDADRAIGSGWQGPPGFQAYRAVPPRAGPDGLACPGITTGKLVRSVKYSTSNLKTPVAQKRGASVPRYAVFGARSAATFTNTRRVRSVSVQPIDERFHNSKITPPIAVRCKQSGRFTKERIRRSR
jgi:hypothetical protein